MAWSRGPLRGHDEIKTKSRRNQDESAVDVYHTHKKGPLLIALLINLHPPLSSLHATA